MNIPRVFLEHNTDRDIFNGGFGVRINIKSARRLRQLEQCHNLGVPAYALFGLEAQDCGFPYTEDGLRAFLTGYANCIVALTNENEWDVPPLAYDTVRQHNAWAHRVCREFGIPFAVSSTLVQDWYGAITGLGSDNPAEWPGLWGLYKPGQIDGEYVDLHLYSYGGASHLSQFLDVYKAKGYTTPVIVGEFGTNFGPDIPVTEMFDAVLPHKEVVFATLFAAERGGADASQDYGIFGKPAEQEFYDYAKSHQQESEPVATRPYFQPVKAPPKKKTVAIFLPSGQGYNKYIGGLHQNTENTSMEWLTTQKILPLCAGKPFDAFAIIPQVEVTDADKSTMIPKSVAGVVNFANLYPETKFLLISLHTDSGADQHFGAFHLGGASGDLAAYIDGELGKVHGYSRKFFENMTNEGYYALPAGLPSNLTAVLMEIASHGSPTNVRWIEDHVDGLAQAVVDGVTAYVGAVVAPPVVDWQARYTDLAAKVKALAVGL